MTPGARVSAAIEVLADIEQRKRPASEALKDWGVSHRFAGSGDRAAIGNLVFDALRTRASSTYAMLDDSARAVALRTLVTGWGLTPDQVAVLANSVNHAPAPLSEDERAGLARELPADAPDHVRGDYPEWLSPLLAQAFGDRSAEEGAGLATRAPVDLRVNTLKASRDKVLKALARFTPLSTPYAPSGIRIPPASGAGRSPHLEAEAAHGKGWFEIQDEGSQLATLLAGAEPREQVLDLCAASGGKTLGLAARMKNTGQLYAYDADRLRLRPIFERLKRAGARNVQVLPAEEPGALVPLEGRMDLVLIDAPCTGSGVWRRRPDAKWRLKPEMLAARLVEQRAVLDQGARLVKPGGSLAYITCSILTPENGEQVDAFLARFPNFKSIPWPALWREAIQTDAPPSADHSERTLLMTPRSHGTDGFFVAVLQRAD